MLSGEVMDDAHAARIGLVHEAVDDAALPGAVRNLVDALLAGGPCAQVEIKILLRRVTGRIDTDDAALRNELAHWIARLRGSDEGKEGLSAFLEKRQPKWRDPG
jgi:methylglutaconyl-CoA hydratase